MKTPDYMLKVNTEIALAVTQILSLDHSLIGKKAQALWKPLKCRITDFDVIIAFLMSEVLKS